MDLSVPKPKSGMMVTDLDRPKRIALVLGAGGPVGSGFHAGVLHALESVTGFDPRRASLIVGTSAGAQVGALLRAGMSTADLFAKATGQPMSAEGQEIDSCFRRPAFGRPRRIGWPSSPRYLWTTLYRPWRFRMGMLAAATLPPGRVDLSMLAEGFRSRFPEGWPLDPLWITAADLDTGRRALFGHREAPETDIGLAVAASSAVPSMCQPVEIAGNRYVDGAMLCTSHADAVLGADVDEVYISSPLSRFVGLCGQVRRLARRLGRTGRPVRCFEPGREVIQEMGFNMMDKSRMGTVAQAAHKALRRALTEGPRRVWFAPAVIR